MRERELIEAEADRIRARGHPLTDAQFESELREFCHDTFGRDYEDDPEIEQAIAEEVEQF